MDGDRNIHIKLQNVKHELNHMELIWDACIYFTNKSNINWISELNAQFVPEVEHDYKMMHYNLWVKSLILNYSESERMLSLPRALLLNLVTQRSTNRAIYTPHWNINLKHRMVIMKSFGC